MEVLSRGEKSEQANIIRDSETTFLYKHCWYHHKPHLHRLRLILQKKIVHLLELKTRLQQVSLNCSAMVCSDAHASALA